MAGKLYLGKLFDPASKALGDKFEIDAEDFTTHGLIVGMTGSGKTGFSSVIIEECLRRGVPVIAIDPKGDLTNLALAFDRLAPEQFEPWVDAVAAQRDGKTATEVAADAAASWTKGLADWGIAQPDVASYVAGHDVRIITPGSSAGIPLNLIDSLDPPPPAVLSDDEDRRDQVDAVVTALLGLLKIDADPVRSREYMLLFALIENAWQQNQSLTLSTLVAQVQTPPIPQMGALPVDTVYPPNDRQKLALALNGLMASPPFAAWRQGVPMDIDTWLRGKDGKNRLTIVYTAHLEDNERIFVTALVLNRIKSWMRRQSGTGELRCLVYMDEIYGYFPPSENPPTKKPLLTLLKQARAFGVGVLLATQNPVDLDYKGLANMGFWAIGRLQTTQDQNRVREGIEAALADSGLNFKFDEMIAGVQKRVFLVHDIHRKAPALVNTRWAMSYLRGPMTKDEVAKLVEAHDMKADMPAATSTSGGPAPAGAPSPSPAPAPATVAVSGLTPRYWGRLGGRNASPYVFVKAAVRYKAGGVTSDETIQQLAFPLPEGVNAVESLEADPLPVDESALSDNAPVNVELGPLPAFLTAKDGAKVLERAIRDRLDDRLATNLLYDPDTSTLSHPGEDANTFALRVQADPGSSKKLRTLQDRLQQRQLQLTAKQSEAKSRKFEKWMSVFTTILSNLSIVTGRKRTVTGAGSVLTKNRMENTSEARAGQLEAEVKALQDQIGTLSTVDPSRFEQRLIKPAKTDVALIRYDLLWVY